MRADNVLYSADPYVGWVSDQAMQYRLRPRCHSTTGTLPDAAAAQARFPADHLLDQNGPAFPLAPARAGIRAAGRITTVRCAEVSNILG